MSERGSLLSARIPARYWTRPCSGNCGDPSPHDSHLTLLGKLALGLKLTRWPW